MLQLFHTHNLRRISTLLLVTLLLVLAGCGGSSDESGTEADGASSTSDVTTETTDPDPTAEPSEESDAAPATDPTAEPSEESDAAPAAESTAEPSEESDAASAAESTAEPMEESTAEPVEESEGTNSDSKLPGNNLTSSSSETEETEAEETEAEETEAEETEAEETEAEETEAEETEAEETEAEETEGEETEAEDTEAEDTEAEDTEEGSTEAEESSSADLEMGAAAALEPAERNNMYDDVPPMVIDPELFYYATIETVQGDIEVQLFADRAPITVNNFVFLARDGYFNNTTFHRVLDGFMAQMGDPVGDGTGGPGYTFEDEFFPGLEFDKAGLLAMANRGPATNGSQMFLTFGPTPHLNGLHTIFGEVIEGMDVLDNISMRNPQTAATLGDEVYTITIEETSESILDKPTPPPPTPTPLPTPTPYAPSSLDNSTRPLAQMNRPDRAELFNVEPEMVIDTSKSYVAVFSTTKGEMRFDLDVVSAPRAVNNLVVVVQLGYYDNMAINQVNPQQFVIAGAIVDETGEQPVAYDLGYDFASEIPTDVVPAEGVIAYIPTQQADDGSILSSGSQLLFALIDPPLQSSDQFSFFGQITEGLDILKSLTADDVISTVEIEIE